MDPEVTDSPARAVRDPPTVPVLLSVVGEVTPTAQRPEVPGSVVGWVVVEMGRSQDGARRSGNLRLAGQGGALTAIVAPHAQVGIEPYGADRGDLNAVLPPTGFAAATSTAETDSARQLAPVDGVEAA